jgi:DNA helicase HerA-like ATPase
MPEVGDPDKPRLVFFFDEAHLLFKDAPKALLEKIEQVVRLIRSKGVGIYFVTQNPADIPDAILAQLGNRVQHALRAYTPADQKGLKAAAQSFRTNPTFDTAEAIQALGVGEALVSTLDEKGAPNVVQKTTIRPPVSRLGPATAQERADIIAKSPVKGLYDRSIDRESAFERLQARTAQVAAQKQADAGAKAQAREQTHAEAEARRNMPRPSNRQSMGEAFAKSLVRAAASQAGRQLIRGVLGSLLK